MANDSLVGKRGNSRICGMGFRMTKSMRVDVSTINGLSN